MIGYLLFYGPVGYLDARCLQLLPELIRPREVSFRSCLLPLSDQLLGAGRHGSLEAGPPQVETEDVVPMSEQGRLDRSRDCGVDKLVDERDHPRTVECMPDTVT